MIWFFALRAGSPQTRGSSAHAPSIAPSVTAATTTFRLIAVSNADSPYNESMDPFITFLIPLWLGYMVYLGTRKPGQQENHLLLLWGLLGIGTLVTLVRALLD